MTDNALKQAAENLKLMINDGVRFPYNATKTIAELLRRWAEAKSVAAEAESARHGAVTHANALREQLAARRDDLAEALVAYSASVKGTFDLRVYRDYEWRLKLSPSSDDVVGDNIHTAAAAIRSAIAPQPPTPQEVAEAWQRIAESCRIYITNEDLDTMRAAVEAFEGKDGGE